MTSRRHLRRSILPILPILPILSAVVLPVPIAHAVEPATPLTPPAIYPSDTWEGRSAAVVRVLDKLDAQVQTLTIPVGRDGTYKSLTISARSCLQHPVGLAPDSAGLLTIQDGRAGIKPFSDWMFAAEPFVAVFESPVYGVQLIACAGTEVAPAAPPLLPPVPPAPDAAGASPLLEPPASAPPPTPGN